MNNNVINKNINDLSCNYARFLTLAFIYLFAEGCAIGKYAVNMVLYYLVEILSALMLILSLKVALFLPQ